MPAGQPATKGPHLLSKGYYSCCARLVKKDAKGWCLSKAKEDPFIPYCYHSNILACKQKKQNPLQRSSVAAFHVVTCCLYLFLNPTHFMLTGKILRTSPPPLPLHWKGFRKKKTPQKNLYARVLSVKSVEVASSSFFSSPSSLHSFVWLYHRDDSCHHSSAGLRSAFQGLKVYGFTSFCWAARLKSTPVKVFFYYLFFLNTKVHAKMLRKIHTF